MADPTTASHSPILTVPLYPNIPVPSSNPPPSLPEHIEHTIIDGGDSELSSADAELKQDDPGYASVSNAAPRTNGGPARRTRSTRVARTATTRKLYRSFGTQTGLDVPDDLPTDPSSSVQPVLYLPQQHYPAVTPSHPPIPLVQADIPDTSHLDPPTIPPESCTKLREHGVDPNWLIKPPVGRECHWRPQGCTTVRIDWRPGDWERHLQTHLPDVLKAYWACPGCSKTFNRKDSFKRHLKRPETACSARVNVATSDEWETIYYHEPLRLSMR